MIQMIAQSHLNGTLLINGVKSSPKVLQETAASGNLNVFKLCENSQIEWNISFKESLTLKAFQQVFKLIP